MILLKIIIQQTHMPNKKNVASCKKELHANPIFFISFVSGFIAILLMALFIIAVTPYLFDRNQYATNPRQISAPTVADFTGKSTLYSLSTEGVSCRDTDTSQNSSIRGVTTICEKMISETGAIQVVCSPYEDICDGTAKVKEFFCEANNTLGQSIGICNIEAGYECVQGACKPGRCVDSDSGGLYQAWVKGVAKSNKNKKIVIADSCKDKNIVNEAYCDFGTPKTRTLPCVAEREGTTVQGLCLKGQCTYSCQSQSDCPDNFMCSTNNLCVPAQACNVNTDCPTDWACTNGYCSLIVQCVDSDPKNNPYILGVVGYTAPDQTGKYTEKTMFDECDLKLPDPEEPQITCEKRDTTECCQKNIADPNACNKTGCKFTVDQSACVPSRPGSDIVCEIHEVSECCRIDSEDPASCKKGCELNDDSSTCVVITAPEAESDIADTLRSDSVIEYACSEQTISVQDPSTGETREQTFLTSVALPPQLCPTYVSSFGKQYSSVCQAVPLEMAQEAVAKLPIPESAPAVSVLSKTDQLLIGKCVIPCDTRDQCPLFMSCNDLMGFCVPLEICEQDADCQDPGAVSGICNEKLHVCVDCEPNSPDSYGKSDQCAESELCVANTCVPATRCMADDECSSDQVCVGAIPTKTPPKPGVCAPAQRCLSSNECESDEICKGAGSKQTVLKYGLCAPKSTDLSCASDADCHTGFSCNTARNICVPTRLVPLTCEDDSQCVEGSFCEENTKLCIPQMSVSICGTDENCPVDTYCKKNNTSKNGICLSRQLTTTSCIDSDPQNRSDITGVVTTKSGEGVSTLGIYKDGNTVGVYPKESTLGIYPDVCCNPQTDQNCATVQSSYSNAVYQYACVNGLASELPGETCLDGSFCYQGRCQKCSDTDTENAVDIAGTVWTPNGRFDDTCVNQKQLMQWKCGPDSKPLPVSSNCPSNTTCNMSQGVCQTSL